MNRFECIISGLIIGVIALVLIFKAIGAAVKYIVNTCADAASRVINFFGLAPDMFWALVVIVFVTIGLVWIALKMYYSIVKERNSSSIVQVKERRAFIFRDGNLSAVSFDGDPITTQRIGNRQPSVLTDSELRILRRRDEKRIQIEDHSSSMDYPLDCTVPIPGCHR
jgi:hypothetical protein